MSEFLIESNIWTRSIGRLIEVQWTGRFNIFVPIVTNKLFEVLFNVSIFVTGYRH